jgi:uncharacterized DUF497 family protein
MKFDWDEEKARANLAKHGVAFDLAIKVFDDPDAISGVDRIVDGEMRWRTVGESASPPFSSSPTPGWTKTAKSMCA